MKNAIGAAATKFYYLAKIFQADWLGAYNFCKDNNMDLLTLETSEEATNFLALCKANVKQFNGNAAYIGGVAPDLPAGNNWIWYESGEKVAFNFTWAPNQPDNKQTNENCLQIVLDDKTGNWAFADIGCYQLNSLFLCQEVK